MTLGLVQWFFLLFFTGIAWGLVEAWDKKAGFALFVVVLLLGIVSLLAQSTASTSTSLDMTRTAVGGAGFFIGLHGGKATYKNTFEVSR